jgi:hypothetical protein
VLQGRPGYVTCETASVTELIHSDSIWVARPPRVVYGLVSDVTRYGEWSPVCTGCWWDEGDAARERAWFTGRNEARGRTWETRSQVVAAEPGERFAFVVGGHFARWEYRLEPEGDGTRLTESWEFLPDGIALFDERYGPDAQREIDIRAADARSGIPATLAAIKATAEAT